MVFLGGEVVVDYSLRLKTLFNADRFWVTSYANAMPGYIASNRILVEGGYEADFSMIYYGQPGRWADAVEDIIIQAVEKLLPANLRAAPAKANRIDVPPPNKDACIELLLAHVKASRGDRGCVHYEVFQQADRPNHFSAVEAWAGRADFDAHIVADHTSEFRMKLTPLSGALFDERIYGT